MMWGFGVGVVSLGLDLFLSGVCRNEMLCHRRVFNCCWMLAGP